MTNRPHKINLTCKQKTQLLQIINRIKDMNRTTDDKTPLSYEDVCYLDVVEFRLADMFDMGQEMTACEHGKYRNRYSDYEYLTPSETTAKHKAGK
jgi:hypothetical protein